MAASTDQFSAIYEKGIQKYHEILGETMELDFLTRICSVRDLTKEISERNMAFHEFREKRGAICNILEAALIPVELFGNLLAGTTSTICPPSSLVFGAVMHLVGAAKGVSASYEAIQDLMQMLQDFTIRLRVYTQESISETLSDKLSDIIVTLIEIFALLSRTIRRGRLLKFTRNIILGNDDAIQAALAKLDKLTLIEAKLVGAETLTESKRIGHVVDSISATVNANNATVMETAVAVNNMSAQVHGMQEMLGGWAYSTNEGQQDTLKYHEVSQGLISQILMPSKIDSAQEHLYKIQKVRVPGTGDWVHQEDVFKSWINKETPVIFMSGNPGAGKSFLAANMISFLRNKFSTACQDNKTVSIGYFFFNGDNPQTRSFHQVLRDLAFQISKSDLKYRKYLATIGEYELISTLRSAWRLLFAEYFLTRDNIDSTVYILLDAVDEAFDDERRIFIDLAKELYNNQSCLQLAIVGRPYISDQLLEGLEVKVPTLHVTKQKNSGDISQYIHASIKKSLVLRKVSTTLRDEIIAKLSSGADGMFLWVNLMLQELVKKRNESSMRKTLEKAPRGIKDMLRHVLATLPENANEEEIEYLNETLLWVTCADRPWTLAEMETILRLQSPEGDGIIDLEGVMRYQWASFFTLHREDGLTTAELENGLSHLEAFNWLTDESKQDEPESFEEGYFMSFNSKKDTTTITFCHASIGEFFADESEGKVAAAGSHIRIGVNCHEARNHILRTYLRLITDSDFASKAGDSGHLLQYASRQWANHLRTTSPAMCSLEDKRAIAKMILIAFRSEESMENCLGGSKLDLPTVNVNALGQWWQEQDIHDFLSPAEKEFISSIANNTVNLLQPMVMFCLKRWLLEDLIDPTPMVHIVCHYQRLVRGEELHDFQSNITSEEVIQAAELGGFEKTSRWFRQCALALRQSGCDEKAVQYFRNALQLNPNDWLAMRALAQICQEQGDYHESIELWKQARLCLLVSIPESSDDGQLKEHLHDCLDHMGEIYMEQGDWENRFQVAQEAYQYAPSCGTCVYAILEYHNYNNAYEVTMNLLKKLAETPAPEEDTSELTHFLLANVFDVDGKSRLAADAALATDELDFVLESLRTAAKSARAASRTLIAVEVDMAVARIYNECLFDRPKAIKYWEKIMDTYTSSTDGTVIGMIRQMACSKLAQAFLCGALEAVSGSPEADESVAKLEKLVRESNSYPLGSCAFVPGVYLGLYYRFQGDDKKAHAVFQPSMQRIIKAIHGDDAPDDELTDLKHILARAGDLKNFAAIAHKSEQNDSSPCYICRSVCRQKRRISDGFSICPICLEGEICPDCVKLVENAVPKDRCSQHVKYLMTIPPRSVEEPNGMMLVDGEKIEFRTWLNNLKKDWGIGPNTSGPTGENMDFGAFLLGLVA
ncbi:NACHT and TPR domain protein [Aspergillus ambiguus]|uniref:NACHT and TPR domain protein n=1 Tax=Aspergillus ambiguus TaxID=176160 RepID=UPI003CCD9D30